MVNKSTSLTSRILDDILRHKVRYIKTTAMFLCCIQLGLNMGVVGPTLLDIQIKTQSELTKVVLIMPFRAGGHAIGALIGGLIYDYLNILLMGFMAMFVVGVVTMIIPFLFNIWIILGLFFILGFVLGTFECGIDMYILQIWGKSK